MIPGQEMFRSLLVEIDQQLDLTEGIILAGKVEGIEGYRQQVGRREGLMVARRCIVERLDEETKRMLGVRSDRRRG